VDKLNLASNSQATRGSLTPSASSSPIETELPTQRQFLRFLLSPYLTALIEIDDRPVIPRNYVCKYWLEQIGRNNRTSYPEDRTHRI